MARANRLRGDGRDGGIFHVTHRCHNREFLLKFARDRDLYRATLRQHLGKFAIWILDYCITSNHVHLLVDTEDRFDLSGFMGNRRLLQEHWGDAINSDSYPRQSKLTLL